VPELPEDRAVARVISRRAVLSAGGALALARCVGPRESGSPLLRTFADYLPRETANDVPFDPSRLEGRVVLITFIATWCFPCLTDLATLKHLERDWHDAGLTSLIIGMDLEGRLVLEPFARGYALTSPLLVATDAIRNGQTPFGRIRELPTRLLFGRDGALVTGFTGIAQYEDLERLVASEVSRTYKP
jgi:thiol-disulfide isomerase/thioredoxin